MGVIVNAAKGASTVPDLGSKLGILKGINGCSDGIREVISVNGTFEVESMISKCNKDVGYGIASGDFAQFCLGVGLLSM